MGGGKRPPTAQLRSISCVSIVVEWIMDEKMVQLFILCVICNIIYYIW